MKKQVTEVKITLAQLAALKVLSGQTKRIARALDHNLRYAIIEEFVKYGKKTVTELFEKLRIEQSVMSQHLAIMRRQGLLTTERQGKFIYYDINHANALTLLVEWQNVDNRLEAA